MSFLIESTLRRGTMLRAVPRVVTASAPRAAFSTSVVMRKTITESAKETVTNAASKVNRAAGDAAVSGIDLGTAAANKVKEVMPNTEKVQGQMQGKASELGGKASELGGKASELSGQAKGKASEVAGETKGKAHEVSGKAKDAAEDMK